MIITIIVDVLSYLRSPWTNQYEPPLEDGAMPSERLRKLEIEANNAFDQYRDMLVWLIDVKMIDLFLLPNKLAIDVTCLYDRWGKNLIEFNLYCTLS